MARRPRWLGRLCEASAFALLLGGACGSSPEAPAHDGGADLRVPGDSGIDRSSRPDAAEADGGRDATANDTATNDGSATDALPSDCQTGASGEPTELRCTGLYSDWATKTVAPDVHQYDPGLHLWSDGANKTRWIYLPPGTKIDTTDMDEWTFSPETKVWKEFVVGGTRLETRLLWKRPSGAWYFTTYRWSSDESSTTELTTGEVDADGNGYEIPTQSACYDCHNGRIDHVLGFEAVALSTPQASGVTMATLTASNLLTAPPAQPITIPGDATAAAALGYLHMNCGGPCHNRGGGEASDSGPYMRLDVATLASVQATDTWTTGVGVNALYQVDGLTNPQIFTPCDPAHSAAYFRMDHRDGVDGTADGVQMPPIISHQVDADGVDLIAAWLNGLSQCGGGATTTANP
ncbi:MAG TPA: hypothetical protein VLC06_27065 [Polyangia bacterium]|nr:hypothetical protein [Polyangia bacterium]